MLISMGAHRARAGWSVIAGVLLGFAGVVLVVLNQSATTPADVTRSRFILGCALITIGTIGYGIATVIAKAKLQGVDPFGVAASQLGLATLIVAPLAIATGRPSHLDLGHWLAIAVLGFAGSGIAYMLYFHLLTTISATHVVAVTYLLPIWGVFWGTIAHEHIVGGTYIGMTITIAGLVLMNLRRAPTAVPTPQKAHTGS
jgi:drug/metabolite transporter (DMT)-like permease